MTTVTTSERVARLERLRKAIAKCHRADVAGIRNRIARAVRDRPSVPTVAAVAALREKHAAAVERQATYIAQQALEGEALGAAIAALTAIGACEYALDQIRRALEVRHDLPGDQVVEAVERALQERDDAVYDLDTLKADASFAALPDGDETDAPEAATTDRADA